MKKRYLRRSIEIVLTIITALDLVFIGMIDEISIRAIPFCLLLMAILVINFIILKKYGKGVFNE